MRSLRTAAILLLVGLLVIRVLGPSDLWDQSQPRTVAYTADMLVHGREAFVLPVDAAGRAATKPPLYNWLALPATAILGRDSELGHKAPSMVALVLAMFLTARIGEVVRPGAGWCAAIFLVTSYPMFKLGYLARPDMLLVLVALAGWWSATRLVVDDARQRRANQVIFWLSFVLAAWTKGPPALLLLLYAAMVPRVVLGSWSAAGRIGWWWLPAAGALALAWPAAVAVVDPGHLVFELWQNEFLGRIMGSSGEGGTGGLHGVLVGLLDMPFYALVRFLPWSILVVAGAIGAVVMRRRAVAGDPRQRIIEAALLWILIVLAVFTLSSGKRADYLAPAYPMAAIIAGWWVCDAMAAARRPALLVIAAYATMLVLWRAQSTAAPTISGAQAALDEIVRLTRGERDVMRELVPDSILLACETPAEHLAALLGSGRPRDSSRAGVREAFDAGRPMRLVHEPAAAPESIRSRVSQAALEGRWRLLWRMYVPWEGPRTRVVECVEVLGRDAVGGPDRR